MLVEWKFYIHLLILFFIPSAYARLTSRNILLELGNDTTFFCILYWYRFYLLSIWLVENHMNRLITVSCLYYVCTCFLLFRFLRVDALSILLSMANVSANSDVLVVDMLGGLLTGAVAERLGGLPMFYSQIPLICAALCVLNFWKVEDMLYGCGFSIPLATRRNSWPGVFYYCYFYPVALP